MDKYNHKRPCPKCGQKDISNSFIKKTIELIMI